MVQLSSSLINAAAFVPAVFLLFLAPGITEVSSAAESMTLYRQWTVQDAELAQPLIQRVSHPSMTSVACAATCLMMLKTQNCTAISFVQNGNVGTCKLGTDRRNIQAPVAGSTVYSIYESAKPSVGVGPTTMPTTAATQNSTTTVTQTSTTTTPMTSTRAPATFKYTRTVPDFDLWSFGQARTFCLKRNLGNLPTIYPDDAAYNETLKVMQAGDSAYMDIIMEGSYTQKKFATGLGVRFNASAQDPHQHWADATLPDVDQDEEATIVVMRKLSTYPSVMTGWDDTYTDSQSGINVVVCVNDSNPYRFLPNTGKYYRLYVDNKTQADAKAVCVADGGDLANALFVPGSPRWDVLDFYYNYERIFLDGYLQPDGTTYAFAKGSLLVDHTSNLMRWGDPPDGGFNAAWGNCLALMNSATYASFVSVNCSEKHIFLCERASLNKP